jgi:hypothetical protein
MHGDVHFTQRYAHAVEMHLADFTVVGIIELMLSRLAPANKSSTFAT